MKTMPVIPSSVTSVFPPGYGFVVLTALGSVMLLTWKAIKVGQARAEHKVPYPAMYSLDNVAFNCIQRAHQNTLENYPQFLSMLLIGGIEMPYFW
jgi:glutathione S-transferase